MPKLTITDFNQAIYYGQGGNMPGGYGRYPTGPQYVVNPDYGGLGIENTIWWPRLQRILEHGSIVGRTIIELGCAFGHLVKLCIDQGADAYGIDLSYPISQAQAIYPEIASRFIVGDVRVWLPTVKKNSYDVILSRGFLDCLNDTDLAALIPECNNVAKLQQIHSVDPTCDPEYYYPRTLAQYEAMAWEPGVIFLDDAS